MTHSILATLTSALLLAGVGCTKDVAPASEEGPQRIALDGALSVEQGLAALNENMPTVAACTKGASDEYVMMLSWTVQPNGSVTKIEIKRANGKLEAGVKECVVEAMKTWTFPKSKLGTRIEHVPVKVGVKG